MVQAIRERGVALIEEFNDLLTNNEEQKQYVLQVVKKHRADYQNCNKKNFRH